ncbi:hypothetical protein [Flagellimonas lutaonensis]|uniref:Uncharacterized protein n=1 Tax=Flagellimonas lutaonensis TaxID=516051 RepID=A0A0D5YV73_9FLAO|nr:hypothetical protein [Allomuricauda lutaonensis]AKA36125.1 hypothetical protein VC82_2561 [Allomuricauda lutaonensis]
MEKMTSGFIMILKYGKSLLILLLWGSLLPALVSCKEEKKAYTPAGNIQLASPVVQVDSLLFRHKATVNLLFQQPNSKIYYLYEDAYPHQKLQFEGPLIIDKSTRIRYWAEHNEYLASHPQEIELVKVRTDLGKLQLTVQPGPHPNYPGKGIETLTDLAKGGINFRKGSEWLGFQNGKIIITVTLPNPTTVSKVMLGVLADHNSWIFVPRSIQVSANQRVIGDIEMPEPAERENPNSKFIEVAVEKDTYDELSIEIMALPAIPDWHEGKGTTPWTFIDEILIAP